MRSLVPNTLLKIIIPFLLSGSVCLEAQTEIKFRRITINDGLSLSSVYSIYQDTRGFMWFATEDGLNKYDGNEFIIYNHTPANSNSLSYKWIEQILEDRYGVLWLASRHGLTRLDPATGTLDRFLTDNDDHNVIVNDTIVSMALDGEYIWVGTMNGLNLIHLQTMDVAEIDLDCRPGRKQVNTIRIDDRGRVWIGTGDGLYTASKNSKKAICVTATGTGKEASEIYTIYPEEDTLWIGTGNQVQKFLLTRFIEESMEDPLVRYNTNARVEKMLRDRTGKMWFLTGDALLMQSGDKTNIIIKTPETSPSLATMPRKPLMEDHDGNLWLGTFGNGAYQIQPESGNIFNYTQDASDPNSLSDNTVNCIFEDRSNGIWLGTFGAGINIYSPRLNLFKNITHNAFDPNSLSSNFIWSICEMQDGKLWIGTNTKGINIYDPDKETFQFLVHDPKNPASLPEGSVREIYQVKNGTVWIGTDGGGLSRYDPVKKNFKHFRHDPDDPTSISDNSVRTIYEDSTGILWVGTRNGLNKFNPITKKFKT